MAFGEETEVQRSAKTCHGNSELIDPNFYVWFDVLAAEWCHALQNSVLETHVFKLDFCF